MECKMNEEKENSTVLIQGINSFLLEKGGRSRTGLKKKLPKDY